MGAIVHTSAYRRVSIIVKIKDGTSSSCHKRVCNRYGYRGGNEKPYGWLAVYRLYSNWGYAWDCMRIDNSTINREIIVILLFGKRCLYIVLFNHCIFLHELTLLLFSMSTVYRRIFTIIIAIHQQIVCTSLICG